MKTQAISYVRFSSKEQSKGDSYRRQTEATEEYCNRKGIEILNDYFDSGISAFKGKNRDEGALHEIIDRAKRGLYPKGTILIVESLDRISRQEINKALRLFLEILENGLDIVTLADGERWYKHDKTELVDLIVSLVVLSRAHEESVMKSTRGIASWTGKRNEAKKTGKIITSVCPAWMKVVDGKFQLIPERVKLVKEIYKLSIEDNLGNQAITTIINDRNIEPWSDNNRNKTGLWSKGYVKSILTNIAVLGLHQPCKRVNGKKVINGEPIKDYYPAIIDKETFNRHKTKTTKRKILKTGRPSLEKDWNLFRGLVKCSNCGNPLHYINKKINNKDYRYLFCSGKCGVKPTHYDDFELLVLSSLPTIDYKAIDRSNEEIISRNEAREGQIITRKNELKNLKDKWKKTNSDTIMELILETENEIQTITSEMEGVQKFDDPKSIDEKIDFIKNRIENKDQSWRTSFRETVTKLIKEITLDTTTKKTEIEFLHGDKVQWFFKGSELIHKLIKK